MMSHGVNLGNAKATRESDKALYVQIDALEEQVWIPKSQIHDDSDVWKDGQVGELLVSEWYAEIMALILPRTWSLIDSLHPSLWEGEHVWDTWRKAKEGE